MGTNYYAIPVDSEELRTEIVIAVKSGDYHKAKRLIPETVHVGKSSIGWQFYFNHNNWKYFDKSLESLQDFLKRSVIEDEYGHQVDFEGFWAMVEAKKNHKWDAAYDEQHFGLTFSFSTEFS